tara:strand:- start:253 stop:474 length:222 start_codon:yes stop_codon:yes gene_type:complete
MSTDTFLTDIIAIVKKKPANVIQKAARAGAGIVLSLEKSVDIKAIRNSSLLMRYQRLKGPGGSPLVNDVGADV